MSKNKCILTDCPIYHETESCDAPIDLCPKDDNQNGLTDEQREQWEKFVKRAEKENNVA